MFDNQILEAIKADAIKRYPEESCGIVYADVHDNLSYEALPNIAEDPLNSFHIDEHTLLPVVDQIRAIVHSHPEGPNCPSKADMAQQLAWNLPFGIVSTDGEACLDPFFWGGNTPRPPLIGRGFMHGVTDCYALVRDYFKEVLNVELREYAREWEWWENGDRLYETYLQTEGFRRIDPGEVREHDCFLAQIRSDTPNHGGIYVGKNQILHHITANRSWDPSRLSRREPLGGWTKFICGFWVRHESLD